MYENGEKHNGMLLRGEVTIDKRSLEGLTEKVTSDK